MHNVDTGAEGVKWEREDSRGECNDTIEEARGGGGRTTMMTMMSENCPP